MGPRRFAGSVKGDDHATEAARYTSQPIVSHTRGWNLGIKVRGYVDERDDSDVFEVWTTGGSHDDSTKVLLGKLTNTGWYPNGR